MRFDPFDITEGKPINPQLGYGAQSVIVDNLTGSWLRANGVRFIPPYQYGVVVPLSSAQTPQMTWETPTNIVANPVGTGVAHAMFTDQFLTPSNGQPVSTPSPFQQELGVVPAGTPLQTFNIPSGTQSIIITGAKSGQPWNGNVRIAGHQTGQDYYNAQPITRVISELQSSVAAIDPVIIPWSSAADTAIDVSNSNTFAFQVSVSGSQLGVAVTNDGTPLDVSIASVGTTPGNLPNIGVVPAIPIDANILAGFSSANGGTIITIPANRVWHGSVWVTVIGSAAGVGEGDVRTAGANAVPVATTRLVQADVAANIGSTDSDSVTDVYVSAGQGSATAATLALNLSNLTAGTGGAVGRLL